MIGQLFWDEFPGVVGTAAEKEYRRAATENRATDFEYFHEPWQAWYSVKVYPSSDGLTVYFHNITDRKREEIS